MRGRPEAGGAMGVGVSGMSTLEVDLIDASPQGGKLSPMPNPRRALMTLLASVAGAVALVSCDRAGDPPRADTTALVPPSTPPVDSPGVAVSSGWDTEAGPVLLVVGDRPDAAIVVFPQLQGELAAAELQFDTTALYGSAATLVTRAGTTSVATLGDRTTPGEDEDCVGWPMLRVVSSSGVPAPWTVGLIGARLTPLPLDSVGSLSPSDSAALIAEVARLASTVPVREAAARLRGLPFSPQDVRRFRITRGVDAIVAQVVRSVHQEANPLEERTLLIAERDSAEQQRQRAGRYTLVFHERAVGHEETLEGSEILAALTARSARRPMLVVARESEGGVRYVILERARPRSWRVKWTSALVRC
jgi:hypothetical protein